MNFNNRGSIFSSLPSVTKNMLIINVVVFVLSFLIGRSNSPIQNLPYYLNLWNFQSPYFKPFQLISYMFMHGSFNHIFFNMFGIFMFGRVLENVMGSKKYFMLYMLSGLGAALIHLTITYFQINQMLELANRFFMDSNANNYWAFLKEYGSILDRRSDINYQQVLFEANSWLTGGLDATYAERASDYVKIAMDTYINIPMVGASGAVFGILVAFAMMFPNVELMIIFLPIPIKAKYFVPIYAVIELFLGVANFQWDNVAHFAHLGGALVGFILVKLWKNNQYQQY